MTVPPIVVEFEVEATANHAFNTWTEHCSRWWPETHSMSGSGGFEVVFEPFAGGRIYERGRDGAEHEWGRVMAWDPPHRLEYLWHIFLAPDMATRVTVTFDEAGDNVMVRLVNDGFEIFEEGAVPRRVRVADAWLGLTEAYRAAV